MKDPLPATISALPFETKSKVAKFWKTRTGSAALSTVTELVNLIFLVLAAAVAESVKAASDIYAPISGKILSINEKLEESPELVNESPYGSGWMVLMEPSEDMSALINAESYKNSLD